VVSARLTVKGYPSAIAVEPVLYSRLRERPLPKTLVHAREHAFRSDMDHDLESTLTGIPTNAKLYVQRATL
jgi:hypothetical protein